MSRIKTRESVKDIKVIDKAAVASERMKTALVRSKDQFENLMDDGQVTPSEYAEDKIRYAAEDVAGYPWPRRCFNHYEYLCGCHEGVEEKRNVSV